jgi:hypothetical protein
MPLGVGDHPLDLLLREAGAAFDLDLLLVEVVVWGLG